MGSLPLCGAALGRSLSCLPRFPHPCSVCVGHGLCQAQHMWKPAPHPGPHTAHTHPGHGKAPAWQAARVSEEKTSSGRNPGEIPAATAGTGEAGPGRDPTTPAAPKSLPAAPPNRTAAPRLTSRPRPWLRASPPGGTVSSSSGGPAGSAPARLSAPASPVGPGPMVPCPGGDSAGEHLLPAAAPGGRERGLPPDPHPALPGWGEEGLKINNKSGN